MEKAIIWQYEYLQSTENLLGVTHISVGVKVVKNDVIVTIINN